MDSKHVQSLSSTSLAQLQYTEPFLESHLDLIDTYIDHNAISSPTHNTKIHNLKQLLITPMSIDFVSGWIGGALGIASTHPIDTVRVRMQNASRFHSNVTYASLLANIKNTIGIKGLYRGVLPPVTCRGISMGMNRSAYNSAEKYFTNKQTPLKGKHLFATGIFAGFWQGVGDHCLYLVKCRAQTTKQKDFQETFRSYWKMGKEITKTEGIRGWRRGFIPGACMLMTTYPIFYVHYDYMRERQYNAAIAGSIAAVCCWPVGLPFDTLRVRIQCCENLQTSLGQVAKEMFRQPMKQWFVGFGATVFRAAPRYGICMWSIEKSNGILNRHFDDELQC